MKFGLSKTARGSSAKDESVAHTLIRRFQAKREQKLDEKIAVKVETASKRQASAKKESVPVNSILYVDHQSDASEIRQFNPPQ